MRITGKGRWGMLLDILSQMSELESRIIVQGDGAVDYLPEELLDRWYATFQGGRGLSGIGLYKGILSVLWEFDAQLDEIIDSLPENPDNREELILHDETWDVIREMADWTLIQITELTIPERVWFSDN
jgi:hypothetical protein